MNNIYTSTKYVKWYFGIIMNAKHRAINPVQYYEKHHITPKSFGGQNDVENLVALTGREHFICHWLLTKMTTGSEKAKMLNAAWMMATNHNPSQKRYKISSRTYEALRKEWVIREVSEETKLKIGRSSKGRKQSTEARKKNSEKNSGKNNAMYGKTHTAEARIKISLSKQGRISWMAGKHHTEESKEKLRQARKNQTITDETREKISKSNTGKVRSPEARKNYSLARQRYLNKLKSTPDY